MARIMQLEPAYSIGAETHPTDIDALSEAGFRTIVCFRPDRESPEQTPFRVIAAFASVRGMQAVHIPVAPGDLNDGAAMSLRGILESAPAPVFGYCKGGMRAASAWALSKPDNLSPEEIVNRLRMHGFRNALLEQQMLNPVGLTAPQTPT